MLGMRSLLLVGLSLAVSCSDGDDNSPDTEGKGGGAGQTGGSSSGGDTAPGGADASSGGTDVGAGGADAGAGGTDASAGGADAGAGGDSGCAAPPVSGQIGCGIEGKLAGDQFGGAVALSEDGSRVVIGAALSDATGNESGQARVFERNGDDRVQLGSDLDGEAAGDRFGTSVAISADGARVAVGSYHNDGGGTSSGNVRVFDYRDEEWVQIGEDIDGTQNDGAGWSVGLSAAGDRLIVGGPGVGSVSGDARVYELTDDVWVQLGATLTASNEFAHAVSVSADGNRIAVSEPGAAGTTREGSVHVYDWTDTEWVPAGDPITGEELGDTFGSALSLSTDGNTIAIGAPGNVGAGLDGGGISGGHARVYRFADGAWEQVGDDLDGDIGAGMGLSISLSGDGMRLITGGPDSGARAYTREADNWVLASSPPFAADARAGTAVAFSGDGLVAAVGATYYRSIAGSASGIVRLYAFP